MLLIPVPVSSQSPEAELASHSKDDSCISSQLPRIFIVERTLAEDLFVTTANRHEPRIVRFYVSLGLFLSLLSSLHRGFYFRVFSQVHGLLNCPAIERSAISKRSHWFALLHALGTQLWPSRTNCENYCSLCDGSVCVYVCRCLSLTAFLPSFLVTCW